jgi:hypothetical protein
MALAAFCRAVRSRWHTLTQLVWPSTAEELARDEVRHLSDELAVCYERLLRRRARIERLRDRLAAQQRQMERLACDRLARAVGRNRERLARLEECYERTRRLYDRKKQLRLALLRGEVVVVVPRQGADAGFLGD